MALSLLESVPETVHISACTGSASPRWRKDRLSPVQDVPSLQKALRSSSIVKLRSLRLSIASSSKILSPTHQVPIREIHLRIFRIKWSANKGDTKKFLAMNQTFPPSPLSRSATTTASMASTFSTLQKNAHKSAYMVPSNENGVAAYTTKSKDLFA